LKQLQLIQILAINVRGAGTAGVGCESTRLVNRIRPRPGSEKAVSGNADTAS
jgi:hypothetical protein